MCQSLAYRRQLRNLLAPQSTRTLPEEEGEAYIMVRVNPSTLSPFPGWKTKLLSILRAIKRRTPNSLHHIHDRMTLLFGTHGGRTSVTSNQEV